MRKIRVLVLSNDKDTIILIQSLLERQGYDVVTGMIENQEDIHTILSQGKADAIVINSGNNKFDESVYRRILENYPTLMITVMYYENLHETIKAYNGDYIWMPVAPGAVINTMERLTAPIREKLAR